MAEQANSKLLEGIAYFEKMLKVMPGDRTTLEFLSVAYEQLGDLEKQRVALIQLAESLLSEKDYEAADAIGERLAVFAEADAQDMVRRIKAARNPVQLKAVVRPGTSVRPMRAATRSAPVLSAGGAHSRPVCQERGGCHGGGGGAAAFGRIAGADAPFSRFRLGDS